MRQYMNLVESFVNESKVLRNLDILERHKLLEFIHNWLSGNFMGKATEDQLRLWEELAKLFPPKVGGTERLYRLVTLPIEFAEKKQFTFKPAVTPVSSWTKTLVGLDAVMGVANDQGYSHDNARIAISAMIPGELILATPLTIKKAFMTFSHDYFERFPERTTKTPTVHNGQTYITSKTDFPGYPGDEAFTMDDIGFYQDVLNRPGGHYRQYECIVKSPPVVEATVVRIYRIGSEILNYGNEDPHG